MSNRWPLLLLLLLPSPAFSAVDLTTLPTREGTQLTIYNSEDITMVREHRLLTVKEGVNRIQFSWANTLIDPTSIEFRILDKQDKVDLVDTTFPAGRNDALQWNIKSQIAGKIPVEIRYFTSGITWSADYVGIANEDETKLAVTGYVRVTNGSGEQYDNAATRLVVGKIDLVEKIADLARRPAPKTKQLQDAIQLADQEQQKGRLMFGVGVNSYAGLVGNITLDERKFVPEKAKAVQKQGLSEYFLFTIEGREDIKDKEPKRLVALKVADVPLECIYKLSDRAGPSPRPAAIRGEITWVNQGSRVAWINRGSNDNLPRSIQFHVFSADTADMTKGVKKATIEVTKIDGDHAAEARILDEKTDDPIMPGDKIYTSLAGEGPGLSADHFAKFYRFKNIKLLDDHGKEKKLSAMENLGLSPLPNGTVRLFSEYKNKDLAYVGGTETKYVPIGDRVEVNVGPDKDITLQRRVKDQKIGNVVARQYKRRLDDQFVLYYDLIDYDETLYYEEEPVSGKPVPAKIEVERQFDANVVLWGSEGEPEGWSSNEPGAYVDLHTVGGRVERVDQQYVKYYMDLKPGKKQTVEYSVTYKRRKVGPELNAERKREPL